MLNATNKIKLSGIFAAVLFASWMFVSCGQEKKSEGSEGSPSDSTRMGDPEMAPDSLPMKDDSASTRPEGRNT